MIRNRYNQISYPSPESGKEPKQPIRHKVKQQAADSQEVSSFPADVHQGILNKLSKNSKTNRKRSNYN